MDTSRKICIILTPADLSAENIKTTVKTIEHNPNKFYLLQSGWRINLWEVVEQMGKISKDENTLTKMRIAYDLKFDLQTVLKTGSDLSASDAEVKCLADLLELMEFDDNLNLNRADYHVIINDTETDAANRAVNKLFQQIVFLWINGLNVRKKSEFKVNTRPIRIAIMGTKKAGKSVLINNFLKNDYTPTNRSTLPTPNTIRYIPAAPNTRLTLDYGDKRFVFGGVEDLKYFIDKEYTQAQKNTGYDSNLPDMTLYYPCEGRGYEIWDTPGLNFVFTNEHIKNIEECIEEVDVCIFVMNYSNYLTPDEMSFLKNIREAVKDKPFVVVVNRIDERYYVDEEKSIARILDYISLRFEDLGYKNLVVFGTSALQNFYLDDVIKLAKADFLTVNETTVRLLEKKYGSTCSIIPIKFIYNALWNLGDFHDIEEPTEKELRAFSGVPQLIRYVNCLG